METLFRAAKQNRIFQDVVDQIQEAIIDGTLKAGDKLPAERELREMLQTSRSTIREALRVLEQKGLIEIKLGMGGGARIKKVTADQVSESLDLLIRSQRVSLNHLAEFRKGVEGDVVAIAALRADPADIEKLKGLLADAETCAKAGESHVNRFLKADKALHLYFAKIAGNPIYNSVLKMVHDNINRYFEQFLPMKDREMEENYRDLEAIVEAVVQGNPDRARTLAQAHVDRFNAYMKRQKEKNLNDG